MTTAHYIQQHASSNDSVSYARVLFFDFKPSKNALSDADRMLTLCSWC